MYYPIFIKNYIFRFDLWSFLYNPSASMDAQLDYMQLDNCVPFIRTHPHETNATHSHNFSLKSAPAMLLIIQVCEGYADQIQSLSPNRETLCGYNSIYRSLEVTDFHFSDWERLDRLGLFSLEQKRLRGDQIDKYIKL